MRAWQIEKSFGIENLRLNEVDEAELKPTEVRIRLKSCSLNYRDLMVVKGQYNPKQSLPLIPLSDGAGEVVEVGTLVSSFKPKDRVCATFSQNWCHGVATNETYRSTLGSPLDGMLSEYRILDQKGLIKFPEHLSYEEAATLPCAGVTAFNAIAYQSGLRPGDTVLLEGTGGVSIFALQFAKAHGLRIILTSSSDEKLEKARSIASIDGVNYRKNEDWQMEALRLTHDGGVDAVIEVGGKATLGRAIASLKRGGVICMIGILSGVREELDLRPILMNNIRIQGIFVGPKVVFEAMNRMITHAEIHPVIHQVFPFKDALAAFRCLESGDHFGKVCINFP